MSRRSNPLHKRLIEKNVIEAHGKSLPVKLREGHVVIDLPYTRHQLVLGGKSFELSEAHLTSYEENIYGPIHCTMTLWEDSSPDEKNETPLETWVAHIYFKNDGEYYYYDIKGSSGEKIELNKTEEGVVSHVAKELTQPISMPLIQELRGEEMALESKLQAKLAFMATFDARRVKTPAYRRAAQASLKMLNRIHEISFSPKKHGVKNIVEGYITHRADPDASSLLVPQAQPAITHDLGNGSQKKKPRKKRRKKGKHAGKKSSARALNALPPASMQANSEAVFSLKSPREQNESRMSLNAPPNSEAQSTHLSVKEPADPQSNHLPPDWRTLSFPDKLDLFIQQSSAYHKELAQALTHDLLSEQAEVMKSQAYGSWLERIRRRHQRDFTQEFEKMNQLVGLLAQLSIKNLKYTDVYGPLIINMIAQVQYHAKQHSSFWARLLDWFLPQAKEQAVRDSLALCDKAIGEYVGWSSRTLAQANQAIQDEAQRIDLADRLNVALQRMQRPSYFFSKPENNPVAQAMQQLHAVCLRHAELDSLNPHQHTLNHSSKLKAFFTEFKQLTPKVEFERLSNGMSY